MQILKAILIAFSQYSKLPVPRVKWNEKAYGLSIVFFPWVGAALGALHYLSYLLLCRLHCPAGADALLLSALPLFFTGGFHLDGFMDTADALCSYKNREEKLLILKDPRVGAFAVISVLKLAAVYVAALWILLEKEPAAKEPFILLSFGFYLSRCFSGIGVLLLPPAKKDGMLFAEAKSAAPGKRLYLFIIAVELITGGAIMCALFGAAGASVILCAGAVFAAYAHMCIRSFGGNTGDLAGFFVVMCECAISALLAVLWIFL